MVCVRRACGVCICVCVSVCVMVCDICGVCDDVCVWCVSGGVRGVSMVVAEAVRAYNIVCCVACGGACALVCAVVCAWWSRCVCGSMCCDVWWCV